MFVVFASHIPYSAFVETLSRTGGYDSLLGTGLLVLGRWSLPPDCLVKGT